jgi:hypothetical protein
MKKLLLLATIVLLAVGIYACESNIVEIPIETDEPVVPVEREPNTNGDDSTPDVIVEFVDRVVSVPANVERQRRYAPGTYMLAESRPNNQNGYVFSVVVINDYGSIAGVYIDQTVSTRNLYRSVSGEFYTLVPGNQINIPEAYRKVELTTPFEEYPTTNDAIRNDDLVVGIDSEAIRRLSRISVNETKQLVANKSNGSTGLNYQQQMQSVAQKIINDNTTYGINLVERNGVLTSSSIEGVTEALDVALSLVQSILDGPAKLPTGTILRSIDNPRYGVYQTGTYVTFSPLEFIDGGLVHGLSIIVVDDFGRMTGVYLDEIVPSTARSTVVASKQILKKAVGLSPSEPFEWFEQATLIARQIQLNQGIKGLTLASPTAVVTDVQTGLPAIRITNMADITIRINELYLATKENLTRALFTDYVDGTYVVSSVSSFAVITILNHTLVDVHVDRFVLKEQAQVFRRDEVNNVQRMVRQFTTPTGLLPADIVVYTIGSSYYSVHDVTKVNGITLPAGQTISADQLLVLNDQELASLRPVPGWHTASSLRQVDVAQNSWYTDQQRLVSLIEERATITDFQVVNGRISNVVDVAQIQAGNVLDIVAKGLFQARQITQSGFGVPFIPQPTPFADGSYLVHSAPDATGAIHYTYMVVKHGIILTWIVDSTIVNNNQVQSLLLSTSVDRLTRIALSNALRESQTSSVATLVEKAAPNPIIRSIQSLSFLGNENELLVLTPYEAVLDDVIRQATIAKQAQDIQWVRDYFLNNPDYFKDATLVASQDRNRWLPSSITDPALSHVYRLVWRTIERDVSIVQEGNTYSVRVARLDANSTGVIDLEMYLPGANSPVSRQLFELPLRQLATHATTVLNSKAFDLPSLTILERSQLPLPSSQEVPISWQSSRPEILSVSGVSAAVSQATVVDLIAYVDVDGNQILNPNEPFRTYSVTILPLSQAITRLRAELDSNLIGAFIGNEVTLSTASSIWGLSYSWSSANQNVRVLQTANDARLFVRSLDVSQTIPLTVNFNVPNNDISLSYKVHPGNKSIYTVLATKDLPDMNNERALIQGQSIFKTSITEGQFYRSQLGFVSNDFGQFINSQGVVIYQHPIIDACFEVTVISTYSGGSVDASVSESHSVCVMSLRTLQAQMNSDRNQLKNYVVDLTLHAHVNRPLLLPRFSWSYQYPIRWEVVEGQGAVLNFFDLTNLTSGIVVVSTTNPSLNVGTTLRLNAIIDVTAGSPSVRANKEITIEVQG